MALRILGRSAAARLAPQARMTARRNLTGLSVGICKETEKGELRVAISPANAAQIIIIEFIAAQGMLKAPPNEAVGE